MVEQASRVDLGRYALEAGCLAQFAQPLDDFRQGQALARTGSDR
jgi:hypothetical protein